MAFKLSAFPVDVARELAAFLTPQDILHLSLASKALHSLYSPTIYRTIHIKNPDRWLLPLAHKILTQPSVASSVRELEVPALRDVQSNQEVPAWPQDPDLNDTLRGQLAFIADPNDRDACFTAIYNGSRHDLILMLVLGQCQGLQVLDIGAMGPRENHLTRLMFQGAAPQLRRLESVTFGRTPLEPEYAFRGGAPRPDLYYSYALFADLSLLPSLTFLTAYAIAPWTPLALEEHGYPDVESANFGDLFHFMLDIKANNSIKELRVSEMFAADKAYLGHVLEQCPSLEELYVMPSFEA